ncbi:low temperature requirement protein A, partial [Streptomyces sp. NPDC127077]|uniref:low temperature requirement protein A n=1 Tax=Streptomyces sp. NPDC127077 TaxID=3347131 RepID=UPI003648574D
MAAPGEDRHATWLELFFDLVAVAGVAQIAHLLHGEPGAADVGQYALLFLAFWTAWICFTLYGNVAGEGTHARTVLAAMFGMAVMAAAVPGVHEGEDGQARALALAYVVIRMLANRAWRHRRELLVDWPAAQMSLGVIPWIVSLWAHEPGRYWLWALGIALDLWVTFTVSARDVIESRKAHDEREERRPRRHDTVPPVSVAAPHADHLSERLGLFVIIVLGEGVAQVIEAASDATWDRRLYGLASAAFFLLVALWSLSFRHGYAGVPYLTARSLPARAALPLHCLVSGCLAALAAGLGARGGAPGHAARRHALAVVRVPGRILRAHRDRRVAPARRRAPLDAVRGPALLRAAAADRGVRRRARDPGRGLAARGGHVVADVLREPARRAGEGGGPAGGVSSVVHAALAPGGERIGRGGGGRPRGGRRGPRPPARQEPPGPGGRGRQPPGGGV